MRGIGSTISRLSAARAVLAGAALLAGTALRPAQAEVASGSAPHPDETAMAVPRIKPPAGSSGIGLPQPLAPSEAARIRRIFALQSRGLIQDAATETAQLSDYTLLGHILADRLLGRPSRAAAPALSAWLGRYADLPDACAIYALLLQRLPAGAEHPAPPAGTVLGSGTKTTYAPPPTSAAGPARAALAKGHAAQALLLGQRIFERSRAQDGEAGFVAGLAAWRTGNLPLAATLFDAASVAPAAGATARAAAAYWSARAWFAQGNTAAWRPRMLRAAAEPHTLHGMLARKLLGLRQPSAPASATLAEADVESIAATPQGRRAFALIQVGQNARAEAELRRLWPEAQNDPPLSRALYLVAGAAGFTDLVADLAGVVDATEADLPMPSLQPAGGFIMDPALVYAIAHVESNFNISATSNSGAYGLMQLMPVAVAAINGKSSNSVKSLRNTGQNLKLGQSYLAYLAKSQVGNNDLLLVLAAYNSGPTAVQKWDIASGDDPLMFIEMIPNDETRQFVQRTLRNLWGYAARLKLQAPSLEAMATGQWPRFTAELSVPPAIARQYAAATLH